MRVRELHVISNGQSELEHFARVAALIHPYVTAFHLREKTSQALELWKGVMALRTSGVPLSKVIINDRVDVACASGVGGVQLNYQSLEVWAVRNAFANMRIGRSVHDVQEAEQMSYQGADYLIYGHIFPTDSKPGQLARGTKALEEVVKRVRVPVIAIGGIKPENVQQIMVTGAAGIAVLSGITAADNPLQSAKNYRDALDI
ncbi:thiamine phosphate synthase [Paenibacillus crassostreae]|uniref:Transcriptional regulator n=2 Tax=Paenibacillus crassostreae TaxID=1763538 RepID=A0A167G547_9BACL|nr:thiamine phosphate synthase [Paenibacillus crassostreae]AOZ94802.1 thiamine phosphate synthase [Paenibacillus crassostreae]OAB77220.1 transcriptional regulator [Paenibacillus crassostreae]